MSERLHPSERYGRGERVYLAQLRPVKCITVPDSAVTPIPQAEVTTPGARVPGLASSWQSSKGARRG